jgi:hypothetical protein
MFACGMKLIHDMGHGSADIGVLEDAYWLGRQVVGDKTNSILR